MACAAAAAVLGRGTWQGTQSIKSKCLPQLVPRRPLTLCCPVQKHSHAKLLLRPEKKHGMQLLLRPSREQCLQQEQEPGEDSSSEDEGGDENI